MRNVLLFPIGVTLRAIQFVTLVAFVLVKVIVAVGLLAGMIALIVPAALIEVVGAVFMLISGYAGYAADRLAN